jgi:hypothetical protein
MSEVVVVIDGHEDVDGAGMARGLPISTRTEDDAGRLRRAPGCRVGSTATDGGRPAQPGRPGQCFGGDP